MSRPDAGGFLLEGEIENVKGISGKTALGNVDPWDDERGNGGGGENQQGVSGENEKVGREVQLQDDTPRGACARN